MAEQTPSIGRVVHYVYGADHYPAIITDPAFTVYNVQARMDDCDHDYMPLYCERCGKYQGMECSACGDWYDGGDHMASQVDIWCECDAVPDQDY